MEKKRLGVLMLGLAAALIIAVLLVMLIPPRLREWGAPDPVQVAPPKPKPKRWGKVVLPGDPRHDEILRKLQPRSERRSPPW
jgi:hypothetical protein